MDCEYRQYRSLEAFSGLKYEGRKEIALDYPEAQV
jgi:hypothetical protein